MLEAIWKYELSTVAEQTIQMPLGAQILCVQNQMEKLCIWVKVDPARPLVDRHFHVYGTGFSIPREHLKDKYIGTYQLAGGGFVGHLFEN